MRTKVLSYVSIMWPKRPSYGDSTTSDLKEEKWCPLPDLNRGPTDYESKE